MTTSIKNMLVGIFILGAITLFVTVILFLKPSVGDGKQFLFVRFSDINSVTVGTRVLFAGKAIGEVVALEEINDPRSQPTDDLGRIYFYQLTLRIDSHVKVYNIDDIMIQTSGLLGEKSISIVPRAAPKGITPQLVTEKPVYANSVDLLQNALRDFSHMSKKMQETFTLTSKWIKDNGDSVATAIRSTGAAMEEIDNLATSFNENKVSDDIKTALAHVTTAMDQLHDQKTFVNLASAIENMKTISDNITQGKGTVGQLVNKEDLSLQLNAVMSKADTLMNDFNNYGVLFHLNKQWQRTRLQKVSEINALTTPCHFKTYFQSEVDDINSAMSRLSILIEKADESPYKEQIFQHTQFKRDFNELLRKADELSGNLRLYNEQLQGSLER